MWKDKFQEIIQEKKIYGEKVNIGATEEEIGMFFKEVKAELNVDLPNDYANILKLVNGLEFNGFILYGIDQSLLSKQPNQSINGLIEYNKIWYENDIAECKYIELDNPSGRENEVFSSLEDMVEKMLNDALA